ncbi:EAL domain-containing protein [Kineosporia sp. J2-2]|uniref:EAL domain-containing protein n=1 Tax=Kineosporia corallincola TaxID=2835133 RepID=A0ABS5THF0_9ACTN|nr:EAL domain-containing protein [Kineosporia corallincola]MBT0770524.1 EAL domain-containing protein [Kineosporia corallincola]
MQSSVLTDEMVEEPGAAEQNDGEEGTSPLLVGALGLLAVLVLVRSVLPDLAGDLLHVLIGAGAVLIGTLAVMGYRPTRRRGWYLLLGGTSLWVLGDLTRAVAAGGTPSDSVTVPDVISLVGFLLLGLGALDFTRARSGASDLGSVLDAMIVTTSIAVALGIFVVAPLADTSTLPLATKAVNAAFPVGDLFLLGVLVRLYAVPGARVVSYYLLTAGAGLLLAADTGYELSTLIASDLESSRLIDAGRLAGYLLIAGAATAPSMRVLADPDPPPPQNRLSRRRQGALVVALLLPNVALLTDGFSSGARHWQVIAAGMLLICILMLVRILRLISTVQEQAISLGDLARADGLTGAPNRRTWDYEVTRATDMAREHGTSLCVAIIDLDKFKVYNDTHGHQAGDKLLKESVAAWTAQLRPPALLARYGGEEFALLAPGFTPLQLATVLERLRTVTPYGQTFSAGVAQWDPLTEATSATKAADAALYAAKRAGRNRVVIAGQEPPPGPPTGSVELTSITVKADPIRPIDEDKPPLASRRGRRRVHHMPAFTMVTQPIADLRAQQVCAHEALARFDMPGTLNDNTADVFRQAYREGFGDLLELAAIQAALDLPDRPADHDLYVNASARALMSARMRTGLPDDLSGVIVELSEDPGDVDMADLVRVVNDLRDRGAGIALDDVGAGALEFARLAQIQPDMVKIDRSLVVGCASDPGRTAVLRGLVTYAEAVDALLCAEGAETAADLSHLMSLGVTHAQGNLLSPARPGWMPTLYRPPFVTDGQPPVQTTARTPVQATGATLGETTGDTPGEVASEMADTNPLGYRPGGFEDPDSTSPIFIRPEP